VVAVHVSIDAIAVGEAAKLQALRGMVANSRLSPILKLQVYSAINCVYISLNRSSSARLS